MTHKYFTTPIYYASGSPHIGHLYTTALMNTLAQHEKNLGNTVRCLTGMDEHGEKIAQKAAELKTLPQEYVNNLAEQWKVQFKNMGISWDVFMRTTNPEHITNVKAILNACKENGDIYYGEHEGYYCVDCEAYLTDKEMDENHFCTTHKTKTELRKEGNYYFKTSKYASQIVEMLKQDKIVATGSTKRYQTELIQMIEQMQGDLSISRPKSRTTWGIELPFDSNHVTYVWFDALPNYVTGIGGLSSAKSSEFWKNTTHILGKDILKFHGFFWPAMCLSLQIPVPNLLVHGWLLQGGDKMSKSLGNVISPDNFKDYGLDMFKNLVFRGHDLTEDCDLNMKLFLERFNSDLANGIGNLLARTLGMVEKYFDCVIPIPLKTIKIDGGKQILETSLQLPNVVKAYFERHQLHLALEKCWQLISETDKFISDSKPWNLAKIEDKSDSERATNLEHLTNVLAVSCQALRSIGICLHAFFPHKMAEMLKSLGCFDTTYAKVEGVLNNPAEFKFESIPKLYLRLDIPAELAKFAPPTPITLQAKTPTAPEDQIEITDFQKTKIRVGTIVTAETVEGSDKLLRLKISLGKYGEKNIFSGIKQWNKPEEVVNRKVGVVSNLKPRKMKFGLSEGMLLSQELEGGKIVPLYLENNAVEGTEIC